jgi:hypothetical protein
MLLDILSSKPDIAGQTCHGQLDAQGDKRDVN